MENLEIIIINSEDELIIVRNESIVDEIGRSLAKGLGHIYGNDGKTWNPETFIKAVIEQLGEECAGYNGIIFGKVYSGVQTFNLVAFA